MAPVSLLRARVAAVLLCLLGGAAADNSAACPSAPPRGAGGAGGVRVLDGFADEGALAELLSQLPGGIASAAKAGAPLELQRFALRVPDSLAQSVAGALGWRGEALGAVASVMPASANGQNVTEHKDWHTSGRTSGFAEGDVALLYLHGRGELEFTDLDAAGGCAASRTVDVAPGRLVLWNNGAVKHGVASVPGAPRIALGPMALDASGRWDQVGGVICGQYLTGTGWALHGKCKDGYCPDQDKRNDPTNLNHVEDGVFTDDQCCKPCTCEDVLVGDPDYIVPGYVTNCSGGEIPDPAKADAPAPTRDPSADGCCMAAPTPAPGPPESMPGSVAAAMAAAHRPSGLWSAQDAHARQPSGVWVAGAVAAALAASVVALAALAAIRRRHSDAQDDEDVLLADGIAGEAAER